MRTAHQVCQLRLCCLLLLCRSGGGCCCCFCVLVARTRPGLASGPEQHTLWRRRRHRRAQTDAMICVKFAPYARCLHRLCSREPARSCWSKECTRKQRRAAFAFLPLCVVFFTYIFARSLSLCLWFVCVCWTILTSASNSIVVSKQTNFYQLSQTHSGSPT